MERLSEFQKIDVGLVAQAINNNTATGAYFAMAGHVRALAILNSGPLALTKTTTVEILQAQDAAGTGSKGIPTTVGQLATCTVTVNIAVGAATLTADADVTGSSVLLNGITFTGAAATDASAREYKQTTAVDTAAGLVACINHATMGVPGITATDLTGGVAGLKSTRPGAVTITLSVANPAGLVAATTEAQAFVEVDGDDLDHAGGFDHIAVKVTTTANSVVSAVLLRTAKETIAQAVGASAAI